MAKIQDLLSPMDESPIRVTAASHAKPAARTAHITIEFIMDTACPNCYIGLKNLKVAIDLYKERHPNTSFEVACSPLMLPPDAYQRAGAECPWNKNIGFTRDSHKLLRYALENSPSDLRSTSFMSSRRRRSIPTAVSTPDVSMQSSVCSMSSCGGASRDAAHPLNAPADWSYAAQSRKAIRTFGRCQSSRSPQSLSRADSTPSASRSPSAFDFSFSVSPSADKSKSPSNGSVSPSSSPAVTETTVPFFSNDPSLTAEKRAQNSRSMRPQRHGTDQQLRLAHALLDACFRHEANLADREVLVEIGVSALDFPAEDIRSVLHCEEWGRAVDACHNEVKSRMKRMNLRGSANGASTPECRNSADGRRHDDGSGYHGSGGAAGAADFCRHKLGGRGGGAEPGAGGGGAERTNVAGVWAAMEANNDATLFQNTVPVFIVQDKYLYGGWQAATTFYNIFEKIGADSDGGNAGSAGNSPKKTTAFATRF